MSYQVLARKWRPGTFREMVGQEHVLRALINALDNDRLHHAYLFTGTRGVGKTTIARIFAKCLNCDAGVSATPCGVCPSCREIAEGRFVDLIEVDAASRTKVEDTRELLENVQYAPTRGRYKVYLIDEVHMLSTHSFNALLKTLEEPPPHVKFLLATTDPQKLPVTILSRCLQFSLKRLPASLIAGHLAEILGKEGIAFEPAALDQLARAADGSMRDALSLLDQAIGYGGGSLREAEVRAMLGTIEQGHVFDLLEALAGGDGAAVLACVERLAEQAPDFEGVLAELISVLHRIALVQVVPDALEESRDDVERIRNLSRLLAPEDVQLFYQIGLHGRRDLPLAPDPRTGLEMVLLRMLAFRPVEGGAQDGPRAAQPVSAAAMGGPKPSMRDAVRQVIAAPPTPEPVKPAPAPVSAPGAAPAARGALPPEVEWSQVVAALGLRGLVHQLAVNCAFESLEGDTLRLTLDPSCAQMHSKNQEERLQQALQQYRGAPLRLVIQVGKPGAETPAQQQARQAEERRQTAVASIERDPVVNQLRETFNARVLPDTIQPKD